MAETTENETGGLAASTCPHCGRTGTDEFESNRFICGSEKYDPNKISGQSHICRISELEQQVEKLERLNRILRGVVSEVASWEGLNFTDRSGIIPRACKALSVDKGARR